MSIKKEIFGKTADGQKADIYTLVNRGGIEARITNYGGIVTSLRVPGRNGNFADIVLGYNSLAEYTEDGTYFGALIGRCGNRIAKGRFRLNGVEYKLATNNGPNHLHGGVKGFNKVIWDAESFESENGQSLKLTYLSRDGEEGYPGNLRCTVTYTLTNDNELKIEYLAQTDKSTVTNLTHHGYFNLAGHDSGDVLGHEMVINADNYTPVDENLIPTGEIRAVKGTALDFRSAVTIGSRIGLVGSDPAGYDHNYVLNKTGEALSFAARAYEPSSGRMMEVFTTEPGMQFYTGNFLDGSNKGKGSFYDQYSGFCLETQHFPDSPNKQGFPSVVLNPGEKLETVTIYKFSVK